MRRATPALLVLLAATCGVAAVACGSGADSSGGSLQIDPVSGKHDDDSADDSDASTAKSSPTTTAPSESDASAPDPTTSTPAPTPTENTCETATDLGAIAGEHIYQGDSGDPHTTSGSCSTWVKIRVNETSKLLEALGVDAKLTSPSTQKFDLYGYVDVATDDLSCVTPAASSATTLSPVDDIQVEWPDSILEDDSRWVTFEVRSHDGKCLGGTWSLTIDNVADPVPDTDPEF